MHVYYWSINTSKIQLEICVFNCHSVCQLCWEQVHVPPYNSLVINDRVIILLRLVCLMLWCMPWCHYHAVCLGFAGIVNLVNKFYKYCIIQCNIYLPFISLKIWIP